MKVLFKHVAGSYLYGTNTSNSDLDYQSVYMADLKDIVLKRDVETYNNGTNKSRNKNTANDKDDTVKDLRRFLVDAMKGQTYAVEMLFVPQQFVVSSSPEWEQVAKNRDKLLTNQSASFVGYARQQAEKYSRRGTRLEDLGKLEATLKTMEPASKLNTMAWEDTTQVYWTEKEGCKHLAVLEKFYQHNRKSGDVLKLVQETMKSYGHRAVTAKEQGGFDWKAVSHCYRVTYEALEFFTTGTMTFPLKEWKHVLAVKLGEVSEEQVKNELDELRDKVDEAVKKSTLPQEADTQFWEEFVLDLYGVK